MKPEIIKHGSDRKIQVIITDLPDDMTMEEIDFSVTFRAGGKTVSFEKSELKHLDENIFVAPLVTGNLGLGDLWMETEVRIPDEDFEDGIRHELYDYHLNALIV